MDAETGNSAAVAEAPAVVEEASGVPEAAANAGEKAPESEGLEGLGVGSLTYKK